MELSEEAHGHWLVGRVPPAIQSADMAGGTRPTRIENP